ncbi:hypothetical protein NBRC116493_07900 [Aurantivibrio infirmus]
MKPYSKRIYKQDARVSPGIVQSVSDLTVICNSDRAAYKGSPELVRRLAAKVPHLLGNLCRCIVLDEEIAFCLRRIDL